jgi:hypothetical protein
MSKPVRSWPLALIAAPAAVAVWSGWVGLAAMSGFGPVHVLPGINGLTVNTAITLPVGVEAYAVLALGAWLSPARAPAAARVFARRSAIAALALGMLGQVVYHLLAASHATRAPWPVVVLVSCIPVLVLGFGAALIHLIRSEPAPDLEQFGHGDEIPPEAWPAPVPGPLPVSANGSSSREGGWLP